MVRKSMVTLRCFCCGWKIKTTFFHQSSIQQSDFEAKKGGNLPKTLRSVCTLPIISPMLYRPWLAIRKVSWHHTNDGDGFFYHLSKNRSQLQASFGSAEVNILPKKTHQNLYTWHDVAIKPKQQVNYCKSNFLSFSYPLMFGNPISCTCTSSKLAMRRMDSEFGTICMSNYGKENLLIQRLSDSAPILAQAENGSKFKAKYSLDVSCRMSLKRSRFAVQHFNASSFMAACLSSPLSLKT